MKPSTPLHMGARDQDSSNFTKPGRIGLKGGGCHVGTVPITRITKDDLIRERFSARIMSSDDNTPGAHVSYAYSIFCSFFSRQNYFIKDYKLSLVFPDPSLFNRDLYLSTLLT